MNRIVLPFIILLFLGFQSCKTPKEFSEMTADDVQISMSKGACFGSCPIYTIDIYDGGYAHFNGKRYAIREGEWLKKLSKKTYKDLLSAFEVSEFNSFQDMYDSDIPDLPTVKITYLGKKVAGKDGRPQEIVALQGIIEKIVNSKEDWKAMNVSQQATKANSDRPQKVMTKPKMNYNEIILEPAKGYSLSRTISKYKNEYGLRLLKKISPSDNLWLVTYDKSKVEAKVIMDAFKKDKSIKTASFNVLIQDR